MTEQDADPGVVIPNVEDDDANPEEIEEETTDDDDAEG
jgi:hypothetical protein